MLRRRAAAAFRSTKPSGRMEARSSWRIVPVRRFHARIRRRSTRLAAEHDFLCGLDWWEVYQHEEMRSAIATYRGHWYSSRWAAGGRGV